MFAPIGDSVSPIVVTATLPLAALHAFEAAARCGSFRRAAEELSLSPSAVSHAVRRLERRLGAALFVRDGRAVRLTADGETLVRHVERGFTELSRGVAAVSAQGPRLLRLHCAPSFAAQWLVPRLPRLLARHPALEVRLAADATYARFAADEHDADIIYGLPRQSGLEIVALGEETVTPLCAPAMARGIERPADLEARPLIGSDNKTVRWPDWFAANGLRPAVPHGPRFDRSFLALAAAADGLGVALESTRLAERELASGRLVMPLAGRAQDLRYVGHRLVYPASTTQRRTVDLFQRWLVAELGLARAAS
jgi:DNA-binding transcriptional LysR family regulator